MFPVVLPDGQSLIRMALNMQQDVGFLQTTNEEPVGVLSNHTFRAISSLDDLEGISYQPWIESKEWDEKVHSLVKNKSKNMPVHLKISLLLCGARRHSENVAQKLCVSDLYLQDPYMGTFQCQYCNPQSFHAQGLILSGSDGVSSFDVKDKQTFEDGEVVAQANDAAMPVDIDSFFSDLPTHDYLSQREIDKRIVTELLRYILYKIIDTYC